MHASPTPTRLCIAMGVAGRQFSISFDVQPDGTITTGSFANFGQTSNGPMNSLLHALLSSGQPSLAQAIALADQERLARDAGSLDDGAGRVRSVAGTAEDDQAPAKRQNAGWQLQQGGIAIAHHGAALLRYAVMVQSIRSVFMPSAFRLAPIPKPMTITCRPWRSNTSSVTNFRLRRLQELRSMVWMRCPALSIGPNSF